MTEEKKVQEGEAQENGSTAERSTNGISELLAQIMQLIEKHEPNEGELNEFVKNATEDDVKNLARLQGLSSKLLDFVTTEKIKVCLNSAKASGMSPMATIMLVQKEMGELGIEVGGLIGII